MQTRSQIRSHADARFISTCDNFNTRNATVPQMLQAAEKLGIDFNRVSTILNAHNDLVRNTRGQAFDNQQGLVTTPTITTPVQFLQNFLPGYVRVLTAARQIDLLAGLTIQGAWEDEQVVQSILELTGNPLPYGDFTNTTLSDWNLNFNAYTVVRFEIGLEVLRLEQARASRVQIDSATSKRESCMQALEIVRNQIGFYGFNAGNNFTYGYLNDPDLPSYNTIPAGAAASTTWASKTMLEIVADITQMAAGIMSQTQNVINPMKVPTVLALATPVYQYITRPSNFGYSVMKWIDDNFEDLRVESAPELTGAFMSSNVAYMYPEVVEDSLSTDDNRVFSQIVPMKFMVEGVQPLVKGFAEGYTNATAGVFSKRPFTVYRIYGN